MKEVEPYFYSEPADNYRLQLAHLEVQLGCFHAVSATVYTALDEERGYQSLVTFLQRIDFSYDEFVGYLSQYKPMSTMPESSVLNDPIVKKMYPLLSANHDNCDDLESGDLKVDEELMSRTGWEGKQLEYREFVLAYSCPRKDSGTRYRFKGKYFIESGYITWDELEISGWMH